MDPKAIPQFGLVAEDVETINPDLVVRDKEGKVSTVRYEAVNAMLLNEFLKEHRKVEQQDHRIQEQERTIAQLKQGFAEQRKQVEALTAGFQKVSAQLEFRKSAARTVVNNQ
jgi:predicted RNase H-like nuclease (RuvC/YqgF family)